MFAPLAPHYPAHRPESKPNEMTTDADTARQSGDAAWWTEQKIFLVLQRFCMKNAITDPTWVHAHEI